MGRNNFLKKAFLFFKHLYLHEKFVSAFTKVRKIYQGNTGAMYKNKNSLSEIILPHYASPP